MPILAEEPRTFPLDLLYGDSAATEDRRWRVAHTKARQEKCLARELRRFEVPHYLPLIAKSHRYRGRRVDSYTPLLGGYMFLYCSDEERLQAVKTGRVAHFLQVEDQLGLLADLQSVEQMIVSGSPLSVESRLRPGQRVRVKHGSLVGLEGVVEARKRVSKLVVIIEFLQQGVSLEIDDDLLEPA